MEPYFLNALGSLLQTTFIPTLPPLIRPSERSNPPLEKQRSRALSAFALSALFGLEPLRSGKQVLDDYEDASLDAFHYDQAAGTLYWIQTKYKPDGEITVSDTVNFCNGIGQLAKGDFSNLNANFVRNRAMIEAALDNCTRIQPVFVFLGAKVSPRAIEAYRTWQANQEERMAASIQQFGPKEVVNYMLERQAYPTVDARIEIKNATIVGAPNRMYLGVVTLKSMAALLDQHGFALFTKNIRQGLGQGSDVNQSILKSIKERPEAFVYLNNGITVLVKESVAKRPVDQVTPYEVKGMSIVNGAQTISTALEAKKLGLESELERALVTISMVIVGEEAQLGRDITEARNHQNVVKKSDFVGLDPIHPVLRQKFALFQIHYAYQNQNSTDVPNNAIWQEEVAIAANLIRQDPFAGLDAFKYKGEFTIKERSRYKIAFSEPHDLYAMYNGVQCLRFVDKWMVTNGSGAAAFSDQRLCSWNGRYLAAWILFQQLSGTIKKPRLLKYADIRSNQNVSRALVSLSVHLVDVYLHLRESDWIGARRFFGNHWYTNEAAVRLCCLHFGIPLDDPGIQARRNKLHGATADRIELFSYLASKAPKIEI